MSVDIRIEGMDGVIDRLENMINQEAIRMAVGKAKGRVPVRNTAPFGVFPFLFGRGLL